MKNIGIYIYENAEVLDFSGPFEVFSTAKRLARLDWNVYLIAEKLEPVNTRGGFKVIPDGLWVAKLTYRLVFMLSTNKTLS